MNVGPSPSNHPLRLVRPPQQAEQPAPSQASRPTERGASTQRGQPADALNFEAVYQSQLPRIPMTEAQQRIDRIRSELVAGRTDVPIHFQQPARGSNNPYQATYARLAPNAASTNESATQQRPRGEE